MNGWKVRLAALCGVVSLGSFATAQAAQFDTVHYGYGPVLSPNIKCLLWTPPSRTYSSSEIQARQDLTLAHQQYLANGAARGGTTGAGTEPAPRQYGVWGATFSGTCQQDTTPPDQNRYVDFGDGSQTSVLYREITHVYGATAFSQNDLVLVLTRGWNYNPAADHRPRHWSFGPNQYIAAVDEDFFDYGYMSHEMLEAVTDPDLASGWRSTQACGHDVEVADGAGGVDNVILQRPLADGFGSSSQPFAPTGVVDNIDGANVTWSCGPNNAYLCAAVGNQNECGSPSVMSDNAFTNMTTTFPVTIVQTGTKLNVLARTPTGIAHLVSSNGGFSYTTVSPAPVGTVTDTLAAYSKDGITIDMFGRGTDGFLYQWTYNGTAWGGPVALGKYLLGPPSAAWVNINGWQHGLVWVTSNDRQIYYWVTGGGWFTWSMPANVMAMSPPQVFSRNNTIDIYFTGTDGHTYVDAGWTGGWQQVPGNGFGLMSAASRPGDQGRVDVFVKQPMDYGGSSTAWAEYRSGSLVNNATLTGLPNGTGPTSAVNFANTATVWVFFTKANQMYRGTSDSTGTTYSSMGVIAGTPNVSSPVTAFAPDSNTIVGFARKQSDGHLIQARWVAGVLQQPINDLLIPIM